MNSIYVVSHKAKPQYASENRTFSSDVWYEGFATSDEARLTIMDTIQEDNDGVVPDNVIDHGDVIFDSDSDGYYCITQVKVPA